MDYEKKYKDALLRAKKLHDEPTGGTEKIVCEQIFPELREAKESEDERIRKMLRAYIHDFGVPKEYFGDLETSDVLAWLEKQGEQKPADKVEQPYKVKPKFKVGDWICADMYIAHIILIKNGMYYFDDGNSLAIVFVDKYYHLWTIQDAKDGDVLYSLDSKQPFIYKERPQFSQARGYCCINKFGEFAVWNTIKCVICTDKYIPATKGQRDTLFAKMKEAGYEWDAEKKELKKVGAKQLDPDEVIAWMQSFGYDITSLIQSFKEHFGLNQFNKKHLKNKNYGEKISINR